MKQINSSELYIYNKDNQYLGSADFSCMLDWPTSEIITSKRRKQMNIYCDGGASIKTRKGGFGVVVYDEENNCVINYRYKMCDQTTNNREELKAILTGLILAHDTYPNEECVLYSDSSYCVNICNDWIYHWARNEWKLKGKEQQVENLDLIQQIYKILTSEFFFVDIRKVKGHAGNIGNELADALAHGEDQYKKILNKYNVNEDFEFGLKTLEEILSELDNNKK